jgi:hypothetical protein
LCKGTYMPTVKRTGDTSVVKKAGLLLQVWWTAAEVWLALRRRPLHEVARVGLGRPRSEGIAARTLARAVSRGLRIGAWQPRCLIRSLVLYSMLRAQGQPAELVIGLPHHPTSPDAHAWVELGGRDVGPPPGGRGYRELDRYPRERTAASETGS